MGRLSSGQVKIPSTEPLKTTGGRLSNQSNNPNVGELSMPKNWEEMSFGEKTWGIAKQIPLTLWHFVPEATRERAEEIHAIKHEEGIGAAYKEVFKPKSAIAVAKTPYQFGVGLAQVTAQAVGGAILGAKQLVTKKPEKVDVPIIGEVSSYQKQVSDLKEQGFSSEESMALVGINAYLGWMPFIAKGLKTKPVGILKEAITTKKVPFAETPEGIRQAIKIAPEAIKEAIPAEKAIIPKELEPLAVEARKYKSADEFFDAITKEKTGIKKTEIKKLGLRPNIPTYTYKIGNVSIPEEVIDKLFIRETKKLGRAYSFDNFYTQATKGIKEVKAEVPPVEVSPVRVERPVITGIKRIFGKTEEQQEFNQLMEQHLDKYFEGREQILSPEEPLNKALVSLSEKELTNYSKFTQGFEIPKTEITPKLKTAVELWKKVSKEEQDFLIKTKKLTLEQIENRKWKPVEMITGKSREELKVMGVEPQYYPYLAEDLLKKSDFLGTTGKRTKGGYLKRFTGKMLQEDSYIKDPKIAIPRHRIQVFRDKMNDELVNNIRDSFTEKDPVIIKQLKRNPSLVDQLGLEEWKPRGGLRFYPMEKGVGVSKKVESYWIPKEVAKELNRFYRPSVLEKTLRMTYDPLIDMWRVSVLGMVPRWLYNNVIGNTMLSILGKTDPFAFIKSAKEMFARTKLGERIGIKQQEIPKGVFMKQYAGGEMAKIGKLGSLPREQTQFLRPIENWLNLLEQAKNYKALRIPASATQGLIKGWIALGKPIGFLNKVVENWFRATMYISKTEGKFLGFNLDKPVPPAEGLNYVNEFLFDYTKLTRTERMTFRRALPFYNWMKNITEFTLKFPAKHPLRGLIVGALLQDYVDYINEINQAEDKTRDVLRIKTDMTYENKPLYLNVKSAIPFSDVFNTIPIMPEQWRRLFTANPISKIIAEQAFGINAYTGKPFTQPEEMIKYDEYGKPILPVPSIPEHLGQQFPQVKLGKAVVEILKYGKSLKRYETGEPKMYRGRIQTEDWLFPIMRYFGISISPIEINKIKQSVERKGRLQEQKSQRYGRQLETGLERLRSQ